MNKVRNIFNSRSTDDGNFFMELTKILTFKPKKTALYKKAFIHSSLHKKDENGNAISYERLEFLGDAIISAVISHYLFKQVPSENEGYLTKMRSKIVSREHLNELGKDLKLLRFVESKIPKENFGDNIYGNVFEAFVGAIFLDKGYAYCEKFIHKRVIESYVNIEELEGKITSYKSIIIEWCQKQKKDFHYESYEDDGNDDFKHFAVKLYINKELITKARATSKKKAEEKASKRAYFVLQEKIQVN